MAISQDEYKLRVEAREALLKRIKEVAPLAQSAEAKELAEAFALLVGTESNPTNYSGPMVG